MRTLKNILSVLITVTLFGCNGGGGGGTDAPSGQASPPPAPPSSPSTDLLSAIMPGASTRPSTSSGTESLDVTTLHTDGVTDQQRFDLLWCEVPDADRDNFSVDGDGILHKLFGAQQVTVEFFGLGDLLGALLQAGKNGHQVVSASRNLMTTPSPNSGIWVGTAGFAGLGDTVPIVLIDRATGSAPSSVAAGSSNPAVIEILGGAAPGTIPTAFVAKKLGTSVLTFGSTKFKVRVMPWEPSTTFWVDGGQRTEFIDRDFVRGFSHGVLSYNDEFATSRSRPGHWNSDGGPFPIDVPGESIYDFDGQSSVGSQRWNWIKIPSPQSWGVVIAQFVGDWSSSDFQSKASWGFNSGDHASAWKHNHSGGSPDNFLYRAIPHPTRSGRVAWETGPDIASLAVLP